MGWPCFSATLCVGWLVHAVHGQVTPSANDGSDAAHYQWWVRVYREGRDDEALTGIAAHWATPEPGAAGPLDRLDPGLASAAIVLQLEASLRGLIRRNAATGVTHLRIDERTVLGGPC